MSSDAAVANPDISGSDHCDAADGQPSRPGSAENSSESTVEQKASSTSVEQSTEPSLELSLPAGTKAVNKPSQRRYCCYIGNMTWWTTDADLESIISACGVSDLVDLKFYENRNNGQSRGFALAVFQAESAVKTVMEKLPLRMLYGQQLVVLPYTKASLAKLEDATRHLDQRNEKKDARKDELKGAFVGTIRLGMPCQPAQPVHLALPPPLRSQMQVLPPISSSSGPPAYVSLVIPSPPRGLPPTSQPFPAVSLGVAGPQINTSVPPPTVHQVQIPDVAHMSRPPPALGCPLPSSSSVRQPLSHTASTFPSLGSHISPPTYRQSFAGISEAAHEAILERNRTICSTAITRAVSDAAAKDFRSAIETLVTAISLIRESRIANDDRCKVLISSLQDTLKGIEMKSFSSSVRKHRSYRDRSCTPCRKRHRRSSRSRSRSREKYDSSSPRRSSSGHRSAY